jgi:hypothetical protein
MRGLRAVPALLASGIIFCAVGSAGSAEFSALSAGDRQSIELACITAKANGPALYHACLNNQLASLGNGHAPDLTQLSPDDRQSIELACITAKDNGLALYDACLNNQLANLGNGQ